MSLPGPRADQRSLASQVVGPVHQLGLAPSRIEGSNGEDASSYPGGLDPALEVLIEKAALRVQAGEEIDVDRLVADYPPWAATIREALAAIKGLAEFGMGLALDGPAASLREDDHAAFGDFLIIREVHRGGMGVVYEAKQVSLGRRVALKILPLAAALDAQALRRFQLEAQVVGLLQHPRIVPVHAVGTFDGVPYFAMQFIEGCSLAWLIAEFSAGGNGETVHEGPGSTLDGDGSGNLAAGLLSGRFAPLPSDSGGGRRSVAGSEDALGVAARAQPIWAREYMRSVARLGVQAAEALEYAHEQGIVHRDVKPANLLLDRRGDLWVADFGMAGIPGDLNLTRTGDLPGTLRYMSPEQASGRRALVDRRTDVYALGATLYELLALRPAVPGDGHQEILRLIAEEEPIPLRRLNPGVPRDLATIIAKAMSRDPARRYQTACQMAEDLARFLDGRPVLARRSGPVVRALRWCRRKPLIAGLTAALAAALVAGGAGIAWSWRDAVTQRKEAEAQRRVAQAQARRADSISHFLIDKLLLQATPEHSPAERPVTMLEVLSRAAAEVATSFRDRPETEAKIRLAIGQAYHSLGDYAQSVTHNRAAYERLSTQPGLDDSNRLRALTEWGHGLVHLGKLDEAEPLLEMANREARSRLGPRDELSLTVAGRVGSLLSERRRYAEAEAIYGRLLDDARAALGPDHPYTLSTAANLASAHEKQGRLDEAERLFREALAGYLKIQGPDHPEATTILANLGSLARRQGRLDEAEDLLRRSYEASLRTMGPQHPKTLAIMSNLGDLLAKRGRLDEAEGLLKSSLAAQRRIFSPEHEAVRTTAERLKALAEARAVMTSPAR
jgi:eukaryotic-like serine/threonine-protein kinase